MEIEQLFDKDVPEAFQRGVVRAVSDGYRLAYRSSQASMLPDEYFKNRYGIERWFQIENAVFRMARKFPGVRAEIRRNQNGSMPHVELICGRILITVAKVPSRSGPIPKSRYRATLTERSQLSLFTWDDELALSEQERFYYAVIIHGPRPDNAAAPAFVDVVFPYSDYDEIRRFAARIDLMARAEHAMAGDVDPGLDLRRREAEGEGEA